MELSLKDKRTSKGMTQNQVAMKCHISRSYYTHIENGTKTPTVQVAKKISKVLNFDWTLFFSDDCSFSEHSA